jgi:hypothetical protein
MMTGLRATQTPKQNRHNQERKRETEQRAERYNASPVLSFGDEYLTRLALNRDAFSILGIYRNDTTSKMSGPVGALTSRDGRDGQTVSSQSTTCSAAAIALSRP